jgi:tRNA pseudouridine38-40 synthase
MSVAPIRVALGIEYDGRAFRGWQRQGRERSVQTVLEGALSAVAAEPIRVAVAGRTDAGVHALGQVAHFDTRAERRLDAWVLGTNRHLPSDVSVLWARWVDEGFHARYSAIARWYRYLILNRERRPALERNRAAWVLRPLNAQGMREAGMHLVGEHDFSAYRAAGCQAKHPVRTVYRLAVGRAGEYVVIDVEANGFLHHMVRNIAGVLIAIGGGQRPTEWSRLVLEGRKRSLGGVTAPAQGLYLMGVSYPAGYVLPTSLGSGPCRDVALGPSPGLAR